MPNTFLCFDFGTKRIGAAVGNELTKTARELDPIKAKDGIPDWSICEKYLNEWKPAEVIVGLPLNMDGSESELSARAKKFANRIKGRFNIPVCMHDERLSSFEAKGIVMAEGGGRNFGKNSVDGLAACLILESWFSYRDHDQ